MVQARRCLLNIGHKGFYRRNKLSTMTQQLNYVIEFVDLQYANLIHLEFSIYVVATISSNSTARVRHYPSLTNTLRNSWIHKKISTYLDLHTRDVML